MRTRPSLTSFSVDRPLIVGVVAAVVVLAGTFAATNLGIVFLPDITAPSVTVTAAYPGASPAEMEQLVVKPIEDAIVGLHGLDTLEASVQDGQMTLDVHLLLGADVDAALTDVQHRVDAARLYLPADLEPPLVTKSSVGGGTIVQEAVSSRSLTPGALSDLVNGPILAAIRGIPGVEKASAQGALASEFHVRPDPQRAAAAGATLADLYALLNGNNVAYPGGRFSDRRAETSVAVHADVRTPSDLGLLPLPTAAGAVVRLRDVAGSDLGHAEARIITHVDGAPAIVLQIGRGQGADEVRTTAAVRAAFAELAQAYPSLGFREIANTADRTQATVAGVGQSLVEGIVLTALVLLVALHAWRSALVVLVAIPVSLLATLCAMQALGFTLDLSSTMALSLAIGILVDDSIVVLENIHHQYALGRDRRRAAIVGRTQIGAAAVAITLVDVVVFLPIGFASGIVGRVLREFGLVVAFATLVSLLVSFTLTPLLAARWSLGGRRDRLAHVLAGLTARLSIVATVYARRVLPWALEHRTVVIGGCVVLLAASLALVPLGFVGGEVVPSSGDGGITVALTWPTGTPIATTEARTERFAALLRAQLAVASVVTTTGTKPDEPSPTQGGNVATIALRLASNGDAEAAVEGIRALAPLAGGAQLSATADQSTTSSTAPISYAVAGADDAAVAAAAARIAALMRSLAGTTNVASSTGLRIAQVDVRVDPIRCAILGVSPAAAALTARIVTGGVVATRVRTAEALDDVLLQVAPERIRSADDIARVPLRTTAGTFVRLGDVATLTAGSVQTKIDRIDRQRVASISAALLPGATLGTVLAAVDAHLAAPGFLPAGTHVLKFGDSKLFADTAAAFVPVLAASLIGMYLLMVILFGSLTRPLVVMTTLPLALVGALIGLAVTHQSLNVFSAISVIMLFGLAAKNGILLVDYANRERAAGADPAAAVRDAAARRFGPIVMTTIAMILGSLPLALGFAEGAAFRRSMGIVVIGGLLSSLVLTLILIPVVYVATAPRARGFRNAVGTDGEPVTLAFPGGARGKP
ncbi:MAG TPA: efflux RND transporter permease subunit [Candidatus Elarobacter sp.]